MSKRRKIHDAGSGEAAIWDARRLLTLRKELGVSQREFADELGVRQQTVSEWETGVYRPRGASLRMLGIVAERAGFNYDPGAHPDDDERPPGSVE